MTPFENELVTILVTVDGVRQVLICFFSNENGYLGVLNRYEGSIPFTRSTLLHQ